MDEHVASRDVDLPVQRQRDRHGGERVLLLNGLAGDELHEGLDAARGARRKDHDLVAALHDARGDLSAHGAAARARPHHVLHRQPEVHEVPVAGDVDRLQMLEDRLATVPGRPWTALHDVVALQRADRDELDVHHGKAGGELRVLRHDRVEHALRERDEVHLVDGDQQPRDPEEGRDEGMALGLGQDATLRVDEQDREIRGGGSGHHVARVLLVAWRVGQDEVALRRREVAVRDVDRDALLPLGPETVGQEGELDRRTRAEAGAGRPERVEVVSVDRVRVVQQAADERGLAVVDATDGGQAQEVQARCVRGRDGDHGGPSWEAHR